MDDLTPEEIQAAIAERDQLKEALSKRDRESWAAAAFKDYPLAEKLSHLVAGDTAEALKASAKTLHETVDAMVKEAVAAAKPEAEKAAARTAYGTPAAGGGGKPVEGPKDELQNDTDAVQAFLTGKGPRPEKATFDRFVTQWGQRAIINRVTNPTR